MISNIQNRQNTSSVYSAFRRMMTHIELAQKIEQAIQKLSNVTSEKEVALTESADQMWSQAYQLSQSTSIADAETERDLLYIEVAQLLFGLLRAHPDGRKEFAHRAAEKRAELESVHRSMYPALNGALEFLASPTWLPNDDLDASDSLFEP